MSDHLSRPMPTVQSALSDQARKVTGDALQGTLVDLLDLSLVAKQAHWNLVGPRFRSIHLQLDEVVDTARTYADTVAERASAIGVPPDGRARTVSETSGITGVKEGWVRDVHAVDALVHALNALIARMRERIELTDRSDLVSQDILLGLTGKLEKHAWMFQAEQAG